MGAAVLIGIILLVRRRLYLDRDRRNNGFGSDITWKPFRELMIFP
jgi:hypothetical protein